MNTISYYEFIDRIHLHQYWLTGIKAGERFILEDAVLDDSLIRGGDLSSAKLINCVFKNCTIDRLVLQGAELRGCKFINCRLKNVDLFNASLVGTSFDKDCVFRTSKVMHNAMRIYYKGAAVSITEDNTKLNCWLINNDTLLQEDADSELAKTDPLSALLWKHWHSLIKLAILLKRVEQ